MSARSVPAAVWAVIRVALLLAIVAWIVTRIVTGWPAVRATFAGARALDLVGALVAAWVAYQCLFVGWLVLLRRVGLYRAGHLRAYAAIWWVSYCYRYVPGKVLLVVERARMGVAVGIPAPAGAALAFVETALAVLAAGWVSLLAVSFHAVSGWRPWALVAASSVVAVLLGPAAWRRVTRLPMLQQRFPSLADAAPSARDLGLALPWFLLHFVCCGLGFFLVTRAVGLFDVSRLAGLTGVYALSHALGLVTLLAPGGLGVREGALGLQLARVLPAGVGEAVAVGTRIVFSVAELLALATAWLMRPRIRRGGGGVGHGLTR